MMKFSQTLIVFGACLMTALVIGCVGRVATEQDHVQFVLSAQPVKQRVMRIWRTTNPVGGRALFVIPTLEHIEQHAIRLSGNIEPEFCTKLFANALKGCDAL